MNLAFMYIYSILDEPREEKEREVVAKKTQKIEYIPSIHMQFICMVKTPSISLKTLSERKVQDNLAQC